HRLGMPVLKSQANTGGTMSMQGKFVEHVVAEVIRAYRHKIEATDILIDADALAATDLVFGWALDQVDRRTTVDIPATVIQDIAWQQVQIPRDELPDEEEVQRLEQDDSLWPPYD